MSLPFIAVDTEFMRTNTYYPIPALIQVFDGEANYLIDPTAGIDLTPFSEVLRSEKVIKVLHACSEDIEVFSHLVGCVPTPVLDTQVAAALLGYGFSVGFAKLVGTIVGVELGKAETRSDWLQRPLTSSQCEYAAADVEFLFRVFQSLEHGLNSKSRFSWALEESLRAVSAAEYVQEPELAFTKFKAAWRLKPRSLAVLKRLSSWRETTAKARDIPRNRVVDNKSLYAIAERLPKHTAALRGIDTLHEAALRRHGKTIINTVQEVLALEPSQLPEPMPRPLSSEQQKVVKSLRERLSEEAERLGIAPELLATRKHLEDLFLAMNDQEGQVTGQLIARVIDSNWRAPIFERVILEQDQNPSLEAP